MAVGNSTLHDRVASLNVYDKATVTPLVDTLDQHSKALATDGELRVHLANTTPDLWSDLRRLWVTTAAAHLTPADGEDDESDKAATLQSLCLSLARFTRNLVAAVPHNQTKAFENEASIRDLIHYYTSYAMTSDPQCLSVTRMLTQCLSNIITSNEALIQKLWDLYLDMPEEQMVLIRLIAVPDPGVAVASFVLIINCTHRSRMRMELLQHSRNGSRLCITYLERMASLFDSDDPESSRAFEIGYRIFSDWLEEGIIPKIYAQIQMAGEVVTPHQTILFKLLDAYLQPSNTSHIDATDDRLFALCETLSGAFFSLTAYTQQAVRRALDSDKSRSSSEILGSPSGPDTARRDTDNTRDNGPLRELDLLLPKVCESLVLVTQCLISLALFSEERRDRKDVAPVGDRRPSSPGTADFKGYLNGASSSAGLGSIEALIETLRLLDLFLPRITFGKVASPPVYVGQSSELPSDSGTSETAPVHSLASDPKGFSYLKRDLVRLLGILAAGSKREQDRVRACGGITVVLNLCVIDDRNPYLREHAIFTLRNLLHGNVENQSVVNEIQPLGKLGIS